MSLNKVRNMDILSQPVLSEGLVFGKCGMTDIDLSCDWQGKTFVFVELKYGSTPLTLGQKYHLQGLVNAIVAGGKHAVAILAHHKAKKGEPILGQDSLVTCVYEGKANGWERAGTNDSLKDVMSRYYQIHLARDAK